MHIKRVLNIKTFNLNSTNKMIKIYFLHKDIFRMKYLQIQMRLKYAGQYYSTYTNRSNTVEVQFK